IQNAIIQLKEKSSDPSDIMIFGYPDWIAFRIDRLEKLHKLDATIYSRFYDNPEDPGTKAFSDAFRNNFGTEIRDVVPKQEILGYDTGMYIIQALRQGEGDITSGPMRFTGLQSSFFFDASEENQGTANKALYIINYRPDGSVAKEVL
ncbi:MAG: hypothetical protein K2O12_07025, partial [Muribaculaceae bacterium]|nr:hypothetical protein [Muribaculaceae bacterium]